MLCIQFNTKFMVCFVIQLVKSLLNYILVEIRAPHIWAEVVFPYSANLGVCEFVYCMHTVFTVDFHLFNATFQSYGDTHYSLHQFRGNHFEIFIAINWNVCFKLKSSKCFVNVFLCKMSWINRINAIRRSQNFDSSLFVNFEKKIGKTNNNAKKLMSYSETIPIEVNYI